MDDSHKAIQLIHKRYWKKNLFVMSVLLVLWAAVGLIAGVLFADSLNRFDIPGTGLPLGFWMAHQGSIIGFVVIILIYCVALNALDKQHRRQIAELNASNGS